MEFRKLVFLVFQVVKGHLWLSSNGEWALRWNVDQLNPNWVVHSYKELLFRSESKQPSTEATAAVWRECMRLKRWSHFNWSPSALNKLSQLMFLPFEISIFIFFHPLPLISFPSLCLLLFEMRRDTKQQIGKKIISLPLNVRPSSSSFIFGEEWRWLCRARKRPTRPSSIVTWTMAVRLSRRREFNFKI